MASFNLGLRGWYLSQVINIHFLAIVWSYGLFETFCEQRKRETVSLVMVKAHCPLSVMEQKWYFLPSLQVSNYFSFILKLKHVQNSTHVV